MTEYTCIIDVQYLYLYPVAMWLLRLFGAIYQLLHCARVIALWLLSYAVNYKIVIVWAHVHYSIYNHFCSCYNKLYNALAPML